MNRAIDNGKFLCFSLGNEKFAIPLLTVKEVIGNIKTTPVPQAASHFLGLVNLRGEIVSIVDLDSKLKNTKSRGKGNDQIIIILDLNSTLVGIVVDSVDCVATFNQADIDEVENLQLGSKTEYIVGVVKKDDQLLLVLDLNTVFGVKEKVGMLSQEDRLMAS